MEVNAKVIKSCDFNKENIIWNSEQIISEETTY